MRLNDLEMVPASGSKLDFEGVELIEIKFPDGGIRFYHPDQVRNFTQRELDYLGVDRNGNPVSHTDFKGIAMTIGGLLILAIVLDNVISLSFNEEPVLVKIPLKP